MIQQVDALAQAADAFAVELQFEAGEVGVFAVLGGEGTALFDVAGVEHIGEFVVEACQGFGADWLLEAEDEFVADVAHGVIDAIEAEDLGGGFGEVVGDAEEVEVFLADHAFAEEFGSDVVAPLGPVGTAGALDHEDGDEGGLAGLDEGEGFEVFVLGAESTGEEGDGGGLFHEHDFAGEEVAEVDEFGVVGDDGVGALLEGEADGDAEGGFAAGAAVAGFHDAVAGAGDDHPAGVAHAAGEFEGLFVVGVVFGGT